MYLVIYPDHALDHSQDKENMAITEQRNAHRGKFWFSFEKRCQHSTLLHHPHTSSFVRCSLGTKTHGAFASTGQGSCRRGTQTGPDLALTPLELISQQAITRTTCTSLCRKPRSASTSCNRTFGMSGVCNTTAWCKAAGLWGTR